MEAFHVWMFLQMQILHLAVILRRALQVRFVGFCDYR